MGTRERERERERWSVTDWKQFPPRINQKRKGEIRFDSLSVYVYVHSTCTREKKRAIDSERMKKKREKLGSNLYFSTGCFFAFDRNRITKIDRSTRYRLICRLKGLMQIDGIVLGSNRRRKRRRSLPEIILAIRRQREENSTCWIRSMRFSFDDSL